jgi:hypothetical protein
MTECKLALKIRQARLLSIFAVVLSFAFAGMLAVAFLQIKQLALWNTELSNRLETLERRVEKPGIED